MKYIIPINFKKDAFGSVITLILYLGAIFLIYQLVRAILGHSWDPINIIFAALLFLAGNSIRTDYKIGRIEGTLTGMQKNMQTSFDRIKEDLSDLKKAAFLTKR